MNRVAYLRGLIKKGRLFALHANRISFQRTTTNEDLFTYTNSAKTSCQP
jgi:hypothetical protein